MTTPSAIRHKIDLANSGYLNPARFGWRICNIDPLEHLQVVVQRDGAHRDSQNHQPEQADV